MEIIILITILISLSTLTESIGVWGRVIGAVNNKPATGYSTHVRIATLGRFFTLFSAPLLGYLVDQGGSNQENTVSSQIAIIGALSFLLTSVFSFLFIRNGIDKFGYIYKILNKKEPFTNKKYLIFPKKINKKFISIVGLSFLFTATGIIIVNLLASMLPDYRAMIVQMSTTITAFGTLLHVFSIDPLLSKAADKDDNNDVIELSIQFLYGRILFGLIMSLMFFSLFFYLK